MTWKAWWCSFRQSKISSKSVIVVGGGQAAVQLCLALRKEKFTGDISVFSEETPYPYHRPPLSKSYLTGKDDASKLPMRPESFYSSKNIDLHLGEKITGLNTSNRTVTSAIAEYQYGTLVIATGAKPRPLPLPGNDLNGVYELRDVGHADAIAQRLENTERMVIVGAGFIGLEVAAAARAMGKNVTVFDMAPRVMARAVAPQVSSWFEQTHRAAGIDIRLGESISAIVGAEGSVTGVELPDGSTLETQMVVVGIGVIPDVELAETGGLDCGNGVRVDEYCKTSDPAVYAAGDCACHPNIFAGGESVRLESIQNATDQARTIAAGIAGVARPYAAVPWFWSDQGAHSLQMTGLSLSATAHVTRGDPATGSFSVFHFKKSQLLAVDSVNMPRDHMLARKLLGAGVSPTADQAADPDYDLKSLL